MSGWDLSEIPSADLLAELKERFDDLERREKALRNVSAPVQAVITAAAGIAFGDYTDLPRLKMLFNDAGVYNASGAQLEFMLGAE